MPASKAKKLSSLFRSAITTTTTTTVKTTAKNTASSDVLNSPAEDATLKHFISSLSTSSPTTSSSISKIFLKRSDKSLKLQPCPKKSVPRPSSDVAVTSLNQNAASAADSSTKQLSEEISSILCGGTDSDLGGLSDSHGNRDDKSLEKILDIPWFSIFSHNNISIRRKELSRERKQKWVFKSTQDHRFERLVKMCADKLGTEATIHVFGKLGRETGVKEYNALIGLCIKEARKSEDEEVILEKTCKAFQLIRSMREQGFQLEEETYGPFLRYLIDMGMIKEFHFVSEVLKDENPTALSRLGYYEMLLWVHVNDEEKIKELCSSIIVEDGEDKSNVRENYFLALCECDRKKELLQLLDVIDVTKISSVGYASVIFKSFGRLSLESQVEKFILACKTCDHGADNISDFIYNYVISLPNLAVEDVILKFKDFHAKVEVTPSSISYEKLIEHCCNLLEVHVALDLVDQMFEAGLTLSLETFHSILRSSEESREFNLVHRIYSMICRHNLKPNNETFRSMINLSVRMKDFKGAYGMLNDLEKMNLMPTAAMYNAIMAGYFREKNISGGLRVFKEMELADVKPDSQTFTYLIGNSDAEEDIIKYYEELNRAGVQVTKNIYMGLINAYATCGQFEKAKQVVLGKEIPVRSINEIKSVLVSALASHGQISDALVIYEENKHTGCSLEPKAIISLIEYLQSDGELSRLLQLLKELEDSHYWADGCSRVILYCIRHKHLRSTVDLLKQLKDRHHDNELAMEALCDEVFSQIADIEPTDTQIGLELLQAIKEELHLLPSRKSLDFLLGACVKAKDLDSSHLVWKEYRANGLPYNVLSFLRMYQALLASGDQKSAENMLKKIPKDDPHVRIIIDQYQTVYTQSNTVNGKKKKKKKI